MARYNKVKVKKLYIGSETVKGQNTRPTLITASADEINELDGSVLKVGDVTATAAELNRLDGATPANLVTGTAAILATDGAITFPGNVGSTANQGVVGALVTASEGGTGVKHITKLTMTATVLPAIPGADAEAIGVLIYTFPATGDILIHRAGMAAGITGLAGVAADEPDVGLGTTIATGDHATLDASGATDEEIITGQTWSTGTMDGTEQVAHTIPTAGADLILTKGATNKVYFNVADTWAAASATNTITGFVWLEWSIRIY
jgi:hypothetical protein